MYSNWLNQQSMDAHLADTPVCVGSLFPLSALKSEQFGSTSQPRHRGGRGDINARTA